MHVLDGAAFDCNDPRSWASYLLCASNHARPVVAPPCFRGVAGSLEFLALAASAGVRVMRQQTVSWDSMLEGKACDDGFTVARCIMDSDSGDVPASTRASGAPGASALRASASPFTPAVAGPAGDSDESRAAVDGTAAVAARPAVAPVPANSNMHGARCRCHDTCGRTAAFSTPDDELV